MVTSVKIGALAIILLFLAACTPAPKETQPVVITQVHTSTPTPTLTPTLTSQPTQTHTPIPTVFGVPVPDYETIPIPKDAVAGMEENNGYKFTSKQAPINIMSYYQQTLPPYGWEIQGAPSVESIGDDTTYVCMNISQTDGPLLALLCASRGENDKLTYVRIDVFITE